MDKDFRKFYVNYLCTTHAVVYGVTAEREEVVGPIFFVATRGCASRSK